MAERTSLDLLLEVNRSERPAQVVRFDSLDTESGLALGVAGVLIALGSEFEGLAGTASKNTRSADRRSAQGQRKR